MSIRFLSERMERQRAETLAAALAEGGWPAVSAVSAFEVDERASEWQVEAFLDPDAFREENADVAEAALAVLNDLAQAAGGNPGFRLAQLPRVDWVAKVQQGLRPVRAGRFFVHGSHDRGKCPPGAICIEIEAGQAFGTGHHGTTKGCLLALDWLLRTRRLAPGHGRRGRGARVLDVGAGSGVLAIAAARAHLAEVLGGDIDPVAVATAARNARLNGARVARFVTAAGVRHPLIHRRFAPLPMRRTSRPRPGLEEVKRALAASRVPLPTQSRWRALRPRMQQVQSDGYDLVFANILSRPLVRLAPELTARVKHGGHLILSGLLVEHEAFVLAAYLPRGFRLLRRWRLEGWSILLLRRPTSDD